MAFTDVALRALKPKEKPYKRADERGLYIEVMPNGSKLWRVKYHLHGVEKRQSLGRYPDVPLAEARKLRDGAKALVAAGKDPAIERRQARLVAALAAETTFVSVAREFIEKKMAGEGRAQTTIDKALWYLDQLKALHPIPVGQIRPADVLAALKRIEAQGKYETARRCRAFVSRVFRHAVATLRAENDPAAVLRGALQSPKPKHHASLAKPEQVARLLRAIDEYPGHLITRLAMQILPHVMARPGELRMATWDEFNLEAAEWRIPPERMKMRKPHMVPLSRQVVAYLRELFALTGPDGYAFPAFHTWKRPMSENTMNQALRRMGYSKDEMTAHGWRSTASSLLNECGKWNPDAIERSLAHSDRNAIRGVYNRASYWNERVEMHQWWSDFLDRLREGGEVLPYGSPPGEKAGNVVSLADRRQRFRG
ncbi:tyrosine-type recombinase/integrase [Qipengyuania aquimaris]|uniref:tyrosine-type recombinase/integrase n=1 Tax=Qipengyuania aquimaris TaxID=255984 RepID=UPI001FD1AC2D|nr:integrase arm-type DNA-binding domain-containing protein [Qipengyuania aquimaris]UOR16735.1 tyrosine-type recombinase/integrase [Qipengyuania aquimaris]